MYFKNLRFTYFLDNFARIPTKLLQSTTIYVNQIYQIIKNAKYQSFNPSKNLSN